MLNFDFCAPTRIVFGKNTHLKTGEIIKSYTDKVLLHYGGGSIKRTGLYDSVTSSLKNAGVEYIELSGVQPNPRLALVNQGINLCRQNNIRFILAVGGGSVIDSAKAIALGTPYDGDVWDFFISKAKPETALDVGVVLTIPAAGSEMSDSVVITRDEDQYKKGFSHQLNRPKVSILNPELCYTLPKIQMANGVCDMMAHIFERYFTNTKNVELTDGLCEAALKTIMNNRRRLLSDMRDYNAWAEVMWAGSLAHNNIFGAGREQDWASHRIEHELSALYDIAHGTGLAIIFPAWMKYVWRSNADMFVRFAVNVMNVNGFARKPENVVLEGISRLEQFFIDLGLPVRLSDIGITGERFDEMAKRSVRFGDLGGIRKLNADDVFKIYKLAN